MATKKLTTQTRTYIRQVIQQKVLDEIEKMQAKSNDIRDKAKSLIDEEVRLVIMDVMDTLRKHKIPCAKDTDDPRFNVEDYVAHVIVDRLVERPNVGNIFGTVEFITNKIIAQIELGNIPSEEAFDYVNKYKVTHEDIMFGNSRRKHYERYEVR